MNVTGIASQTPQHRRDGLGKLTETAFDRNFLAPLLNVIQIIYINRELQNIIGAAVVSTAMPGEG